MILVDTNVWSELTKDRCDRNVAAWLVANEANLLLSPIVLAEIYVGMENPKAAAKRSMLEAWCAQLEADYGSRMFDFEARAARAFGRLVAMRNAEKQETKLLDILIAAQALAFDLPVATRNTKDFQWTGVELINPWEPGSPASPNNPVRTPAQ